MALNLRDKKNLQKFVYISLTVFLTSLLNLTACSSPSSSSSTIDQWESQIKAYYSSKTYFKVNVYYESEATPFTGTNSRGFALWSILYENLNALLQYRSNIPTLNIPTDLSSMTQIPTQNRSSWLATDVVALASQLGVQGLTNDTTANFTVIFLNGFYDSGAGPINSTIGISIRGTNIIAIFKDVILSTTSGSGSLVPKYVEQSTLVHEIGHSMGLVNNGVPLSSDYQDTQNGAHSKNQNCVMYYLNEGASDLKQFVGNLISSGNSVMWGTEILEDVRAYSK